MGGPFSDAPQDTSRDLVPGFPGKILCSLGSADIPASGSHVCPGVALALTWTSLLSLKRLMRMCHLLWVELYPLKRYTQVLTSRTSKRNHVWRQGPLRGGQVSHEVLRPRPDPIGPVSLEGKESRTQTHTEEGPCECGVAVHKPGRRGLRRRQHGRPFDFGRLTSRIGSK